MSIFAGCASPVSTPPTRLTRSEDPVKVRDLSPRAHDLVPLELATALIFRRVYEERIQVRVEGRSKAHLDGLAYLIANMVTLYTYAQDGSDIRELPKEAIATGLFRDGARVLYFLDGREPITNLALKADAINSVVSAMHHAAPVFEEERRFGR